MAFAKRKPEPAPDVGGEILSLRRKLEAFLDAEVARTTFSPEDDARIYGPDIRGLSADGA